MTDAGIADISERETTEMLSVKYPLEVQYCGVCSMPLEYCEYSGMTDKCLKWLEANLPCEFEKLDLGSLVESSDAEKKHQKRGGKGSKTVSEKNTTVKKNVATKITLQRAARGKNKSVTVIKGLASFDVDLKAAAKLFAGRFACGSSVTATDEIVVQGDVKDEIVDIIGSKWPHINSNLVEDLGDQKR
uniref:Density-regulated protein n=1 Tax=Setaria digitata TaxID=48799 RepID=A0A915Q5N8_9BILA